MRSIRSLRGLFGFAVVALVGTAIAQTQTAAAPSEAPAVELGARQEVTLTPEQMLAEAKGFLPAMDRSAVMVRRMLADAREKRDVVRVLCLNDKLNQIDLAIRTANDRMDALRAAAEQKDADRTKHEYTVVQVLRDRVNTLVTESQQCIGEESGFIGDARTIVEIDPNLPEEEIPAFPEDPFVSQPPFLTSPTGG